MCQRYTTPRVPTLRYHRYLPELMEKASCCGGCICCQTLPICAGCQGTEANNLPPKDGYPGAHLTTLQGYHPSAKHSSTCDVTI